MRLTLLLLLAAAAAGCHKRSTAALAPPASLFTSDDLQSNATFYLSSTSITARMNGANQFFIKEPALTAQSDVDKCVQARLEAVPMTADHANVTASATLDLRDCFASPGLTVTDGTYRLQYWLGCPASDLSALDGQPLGDFSVRGCGDFTDHHLLINLELVTDISGSQTVTAADGSTASVPYELNARSLYALQMPTGDPCLVTHAEGAFAWLDDCEQVRRLSYLRYDVNGVSDPASGHDDFEALSYSAIKAPDSPTSAQAWFQAGTMAVTWDNWQGSVPFADAAKPPPWSMSDGTTTVTGVVGSASLTSFPTQPTGSR